MIHFKFLFCIDLKSLWSVFYYFKKTIYYCLKASCKKHKVSDEEKQNSLNIKSIELYFFNNICIFRHKIRTL